MTFLNNLLTEKTAAFRWQGFSRWKWVGLCGLIVIVFSTAGVAWSRVRSTANPSQATAKEVRELVAKVSKHIVIKTGEEPTIATVQDPDVLRAQNPIFYLDAKKGDRLFVWSDKAVLYSPSTDRILAVLPINYPTTASAGADAASANEISDPSIEVRNGSGVPGLGKIFAANIKKQGMNATVNGNAKQPPYPHTVIVKKSDGVSAKTMDALTTLSKGTISSLPKGEDPSKSDVLVIVGADYRQ